MRTRASFLLFISLLTLIDARARCTLNYPTGKVFSLSGTATRILEEVKVLSDVAGISVFYPKPTSFSGEIIPGGIFLSPRTLEGWKNALVFYDQSDSLKKVLERHGVRAQEISVRGLTPREAVEKTWKTLSPYIKGCDSKELLERVSSLEARIRKKMPRSQKILFFLGDTTVKKLPELVIANDGLVLWLRQNQLIETYPSELHYVNWSGAVVESLRKDHLILGLREATVPRVEGAPGRQTLFYPGALIPGLSQLEAWLYFLDHQQGLK